MLTGRGNVMGGALGRRGHLAFLFPQPNDDIRRSFRRPSSFFAHAQGPIPGTDGNMFRQ